MNVIRSNDYRTMAHYAQSCIAGLVSFSIVRGGVFGEA
jgi:hypothetical protein